MPTKIGALHLARLRLDARRLIELGQRRRLPLRQVDTGYLVHCALGELFGESAPKPFAVTAEAGRFVEVLAYTDHSAESLSVGAATFADPWIHAASDWDAFSVKEMPRGWPVGTRLGFSVRVCPVVRMPRGSTRYRPGAEIDAFLSQCANAGDGVRVNRQDVYKSWLIERVEGTGGARVVKVQAQKFQLEQLSRRTQEAQRTTHVTKRPEARMVGEVEVTESDAFEALLRRGVGRHRAFGFGMVLLRRPG